MIKRGLVCLIVFGILGLQRSNAQLTFPNGTTLNLETTTSYLYIETAILFYTGNNKVVDYNWSRAINDSLDPRWDFQACMNGDCKVGLPASGPFITDFGINDTTGFIRFHINTESLSGTSILKYYVTHNTNPTDQALLTFNITYLNNTAVQSISPSQKNITVYPNPASDFITIQGLSDQKTTVYNYLCERVAEIDAPLKNDAVIIPTAHLPEGIYVVRNGDYSKMIYIQHH